MMIEPITSPCPIFHSAAEYAEFRARVTPKAMDDHTGAMAIRLQAMTDELQVNTPDYRIHAELMGHCQQVGVMVENHESRRFAVSCRIAPEFTYGNFCNAVQLCIEDVDRHSHPPRIT